MLLKSLIIEADSVQSTTLQSYIQRGWIEIVLLIVSVTTLNNHINQEIITNIFSP